MVSGHDVFYNFREEYSTFNVDSITTETDRLLTCQQCMEVVGKSMRRVFLLPELVAAGEVFKQVS